MSSEPYEVAGDMRVDTESLYLEELFTDLNVATIRRLTPVKVDGSPDTARKVRYLGQTQLLTQVGPLPIQCEIEADSLEGAFVGFPEAVKEAIDHTMDEVRELRRQQASQIVVPEVGPSGRIQLK